MSAAAAAPDPDAATPLLFVPPRPSAAPRAPPAPHVALPLGEPLPPVPPHAPDPPDPPDADRRRPRWLALLILPGRVAVGALSFLAGAGIAKQQHHASRHALVVSGLVSVVFGQLLVTAAARHARRRSEEEAARAAAARQQRVAWFDAIQAVGKIVDTFSSGLAGPAKLRNVFLDTSLLRMLHASVADHYFDVARRKPPSQPDVLVAGRYFLDYALATYGFFLLKVCGVIDPQYNLLVEGARGIDVAKYMLRLTDQQVLHSMLDGEGIGVPRYFVALDDAHRCVVVAIRGTNCISDVITDLLCENQPFAGGFAHAGMKSAAESLYVSLLPVLRSALAKRPGYIIVVTGHSLGAGVAILLTKVLLMNGFTYVKCYAIAPCPVFGPMHKVDSDWSDAIECFVNADDLVSKLCLSSARTLALEVEQISDLDIAPADKKMIVNRNDVNRLADLIARHRDKAPDPREDEVEQLFIPTHHGVHWLVPEEDVEQGMIRRRRAKLEKEYEHLPPAYFPMRRYASYMTRPRYFERMLVTPACISSHFLNSYTAAFAGLDLPPRGQLPPPPTVENFSKPWYSNEFG